MSESVTEIVNAREPTRSGSYISTPEELPESLAETGTSVGT